MKKTNRKNEASREKPDSPSHALPPGARVSSMRRWLVLLGCLAVGGVGMYFALNAYVFPKLPNSVVGTWQVQGGELNGTQMTFHRDGTFSSMVTIDGRDIPIEAHVALHDKSLQFTVVNGLTGRQETKIQTIRSLTPTEMIVEESGGTSKLVRVK